MRINKNVERSREEREEKKICIFICVYIINIVGFIKLLRSGVANMEKAVREIRTVDFGFGSVEAKDGRLR